MITQHHILLTNIMSMICFFGSTLYFKDQPGITLILIAMTVILNNQARIMNHMMEKIQEYSVRVGNS
jgi:hypothetical protein